MMRNLIVSLAIALCVAPAWAAPPSKQELELARRRFLEGQRLYEARQYPEAIRAYEEAYEYAPRPLLLFNIGQAYRLLGDKRQAIEHYQRYLQAEPNGRAIVEASAFVSALTRELELEAAPVARRPPEPKLPEEPRPAPPPAPAVRVAAPPPLPAPRGAGLKLGGLVAGGAGVALLGVGTAFALHGKSLDDQQYGGRYDPSLAEAGRAANRNAAICFATGGAALVTGSVLYFLGVRAGAEVRVTVAPATANVTVFARW